jgi:hypothetical protein
MTQRRLVRIIIETEQVTEVIPARKPLAQDIATPKPEEHGVPLPEFPLQQEE